MLIGSFFSGIGGLDLGLERARLGRTVYMCQASSAVLGDKDGYADHAVAVLRARFSGALVDTRSIKDVRLVDGEFDVIAGGFPCQDVSFAGPGEGLRGKRSGLWFAMLQRIAEAMPRVVVAENVAALQSRGLDDVAEGLRELGYTVWASRIRAEDVGAPHRRERILIVGLLGGGGCEVDAFGGRWTTLDRRGVRVGRWMDGQGRRGLEEAPRAWATPLVADGRKGAGMSRERRENRDPDTLTLQAKAWPTLLVSDGKGASPGDLRRNSPGLRALADGPLNPAWVEQLMGFPLGWTHPDADPIDWSGWPMPQGPEQYPHEPPRMVAPREVPRRKQRLMTLGNAVVPQVGYIAGRFAVEALAGERRGQMVLL